jgi:large subunit ribosomal protein L25
MEAVIVDLQPREVTGKAVKRLRKDGIVPAVIHDHGKDSVNVQLEYQLAHNTFVKAGRHHPVQISAQGKKYTALIRNVTRDARYNSITHMVFNAVKANEKVEAEIPIKPRYAEDNDSSPAERAGLIVLTNLDSLKVKALPKDLPDNLEYDAEKLVEIGDHVTVADLKIPSNVEIEAADREHTIATVYEPSALQAKNDALAGEAAEEDVEKVESEHESTLVEGDQKDEPRPGGKQEKEDNSQARNPEKK